MPPLFNRLTVFDGRYPHGVRPVEGTRDPLKARLVLHGWFTEQAPFFDGEGRPCGCCAAPCQAGLAADICVAAGPLTEDMAADALQPVLDDLYQVWCLLAGVL